MIIVVKAEVESWAEPRQEWRPWGSMDLVLPVALVDVAELTRTTFEEFAKKSIAPAGYYRAGGGPIIEWRDGRAMYPTSTGPRDLACGKCLATTTTSKQPGETIHCSECGYTLTVEAS